MLKKLTRHGNSLALVIDKGVLELLNIDDQTPLEISTDGTLLLISPVRDEKRRIRFQEALEKGAGQELGGTQLFCDHIEVVIGSLLGEPLLEAEELLKGIVEPETGRGAAEEVVVAGEDAPDLARVLDLFLADS